MKFYVLIVIEKNIKRAINSAARVFGLHPNGRGFESLIAHYPEGRSIRP